MSKQTGPQPTPISVLLSLYSKPNQPQLTIDGLDQIDIKTQIQYLDPERCNTDKARKEILRQFNLEDLKTNAYKRIRFKSMLCQYHKDWFKIRTQNFKEIKTWTDRDFALNVMVYFIKHSDENKGSNETEEKQQKRLNTTWRFLDFLTQFFDKNGFNGKDFIDKHVPKRDGNQEKKGSGFGLTIVKQVCQQFNQKTGQYTKVKKQLSAWAKKNVERHQEEEKFNLAEIKEDEEMDGNGGNNNGGQQMNDNQGGNIVNNSVHNNQPQQKQNNMNKNQNQNQNNDNGLGKKKGEKWYWFCDEGGIKWVPYKDEHQKIIEDAWCSNKQNVVVMERFKIDFHRDGNNGVAAGQQYNYQIHNSWRRGVIRGKPNDNRMLNDIPCDAHPR